MHKYPSPFTFSLESPVFIGIPGEKVMGEGYLNKSLPHSPYPLFLSISEVGKCINDGNGSADG